MTVASKNQWLLFLIFACLLFLLLALIIDQLGGLFLARNPFSIRNDYPAKDDAYERKAGVCFVKWTYRLASIIIPTCLLLYQSTLTQGLGLGLACLTISYWYRAKK